MRKIQNKAQMEVANAPSMVLIVGLVFLCMATIAFIGQKYGDALDVDDTSVTVTNETGYVNNTGYVLRTSSDKENYVATITNIKNATSGLVIGSGNYTLSNNVIRNASAVNYNTVNITYSYVYSAPTWASNITNDLETEISNNTSIAGIVLTISLVGIVLTILIGVFVGIRGRNRV